MIIYICILYVCIYIYITDILPYTLIIITITSHYIIHDKTIKQPGFSLWIPPEVYRGKATDVRQLPSEAGFGFGDVCGGGNKI